MYLKKLYRHNKFLFLIIALFALAQLINNVRQDIAISPVYSYGMYSEKINPASSYSVIEIFVNGNQLRTKDFTSHQWDNITFPVRRFYEQESWNLFQWQTDIRRLLPFADSSKFVNHLSEAEFKEWYRHHLQLLLHKNIDSVNIVFNKYYFDGKLFTKANEIER